MISTILFDFIMALYVIIYLLYMLLTRRFYPGLLMRFGFFNASCRARFRSIPSLWLHAVSVGEVALLESLIHQLQIQYPNNQLVVTVTTKTGYILASERLGKVAVVLPSPIDFSWVVRRFIKLIRPSKYIIAETEIWPNLFYALKQQGIPIAIINARLSDQSFPRYQMIKPFIKSVFNCVDVIGAQSELDRSRFCSLGANPDHVKMMGNLKFDGVVAPALDNQVMSLKGDKLFFIAGSTHPGEEEIVLAAFARLQAIDSRWCLIIAPRHIERVTTIMAIITKQGYVASRFSQWQQGQLPAAVIVVDTIGHLATIYALGNLVFVGKSLCVGGGHNIIEPAILAKPIVVGPLMDNFKDIARLFVAANAIHQVSGPDQFISKVVELANHPDECVRLGQRALAVVKSHQGVLTKTIDMIKAL